MFGQLVAKKIKYLWEVTIVSEYFLGNQINVNYFQSLEQYEGWHKFPKWSRSTDYMKRIPMKK